MGFRSHSCRWFILLSVITAPALADPLAIPPEQIADGEPATMMRAYWLRQADEAIERWKADYEKRKTPEEIAAYQQRIREGFLESLGGLPERTPLNPQVTGVVRREGYRVEKVIFESQPKHYVTGLFFVPDAGRHKPPYPGVLVPCGHAKTAKGHDAYQTIGALLALNGMAAFVFDPIDQGERSQYLGEGGWPKLWGTRSHTMLGIGCILLGRNTARFEIWDGMRAIDYLLSRPEIDVNRIGCTGNSGGGTQTSYLMALDGRIKAAAPSCYICGFPALLHTIGPQDAEQNIFGQVAFGMDHADYVMMRAPTPILLCTATEDFFDIGGAWDVFRYAKRLYTRMGYAERVGLLENDAKHNYNKLQREGVARWMARWLLGKEDAIEEPPIELLSESEYQCTPEGQVMKLPGARSTYDLNLDYEHTLAKKRESGWRGGDRVELTAKVRRIAGARSLDKLPKPSVERLGGVARSGYRIEKLLLRPEEGIWLPALQFVPEEKAKRVVLYVHELGKTADAAPDGRIEKLVRAGNAVLAVDLRGTGQTQAGGPPKPGAGPSVDFKGVFLAYLLGRNYVGARAEDVLVCARHAAETSEIGGEAGIHLIAIGNVGVPALHAAALEPDLFASVTISRSLCSWSNVIELGRTQGQLTNVVHGALTCYDLSNLAEMLGDKLTITDPEDALERPMDAATVGGR